MPNEVGLKYGLRTTFILGLPRTSITLMEQIISSHSAVTGAGELSYVEIFGHSIATGMRKPHIKTIINFRKSYIEALKKWSKNSFIVTA